MVPIQFMQDSLNMFLVIIDTLLKFDDPLSYKRKKFEIESSDARVRNDDFSEKVYKSGDALPPDKNIGDRILIPKGTVVEIINTATKPAPSLNQNDKLFVFVKDVGWTSPDNLKGKFLNETLGVLLPPVYISEDPSHKTVGDKRAILRQKQAPTYVERRPKQKINKGDQVIIKKTSLDGKFVLVAGSDGVHLGWTALSNLDPTPPDPNKPLQRLVQDRDARLRDEVVDYNEMSNTDPIPQGTLVIVKETSQDTKPVGAYVRVAKVEQQGANYIEAGEWGWTAASNLVDGWADIYGGNAAWDNGNYTGLVKVIGIQGNKGPEQITTRNLAAYLRLQEAAAKGNLELAIRDGFRDFPKQKRLRECYDAKRQGCLNATAHAGWSNHQDGQALDLNTGGFNTTLYNWMTQNAPTYGWIRTVNKEHWHWEYRPSDVAKYNSYKLPGVTQ